MPVAASEELDTGGTAQPLEDRRDIRQVPAVLDELRLAQLLQEHRRQRQVQAGHIGILVGVMGDTLVAEQDVAQLALVRLQQMAQVVRRLIEMQAQRVLDGRRLCYRPLGAVVGGYGQHLSLTNQGLASKRILETVYRKRSERRKGGKGRESAAPICG